MLRTLCDAVVRFGDRVGFGTVLLAGAGCALCFPALAGIGSAVGLSVLGQWEGMLVAVVIPTVAVLLIVINLVGYMRHRRWRRTALGLIGPVLILLGALAMRELYFYTGLAILLGVSVWDLISSRNKRCEG
ncbi:MerC family mercury resistance protein [Aquisalimonas lutea]|uniref:MerC family mercury resistance protein n=1 Tax=Aquisalimonas lutea TaxID=1327750 RepID=UPI0025B4F849|nr:MerC family mercury resistance protein [Aquisalimonas lutea]MDN3518112.1 MerC family mercury resistance protein [Aquisalimonas lutea]